MVTIKSSFMGNFKLGDNICFNLAILKTLYDLRAAGNPLQKRHLQKPITVMNVSIIEAVLYDLHLRVKTFTSEGVANIQATVIEYIRGKKIDELERYIASAKKHDLFDQGDSGFYEALDDLRKIRNRLHIQNTRNHFEPDDVTAFSEARMMLSEQAVEHVLRTMARKYPRPQHNFVKDFILPWQPHFEDVPL
ncbi:molecular chaperone TorD family protein [Bradyrhizobium sp. URHA0013]|uniref:molecular chaperone TorD family protein n=1 Tax=Bradyrhizobium sp. URHA0013 TaxID=1380352 RepID=UPI000482A2CA|nr:molecular chaperone TorD family protein [Bradyrhizobium sp. URHA0013]